MDVETAQGVWPSMDLESLPTLPPAQPKAKATLLFAESSDSSDEDGAQQPKPVPESPAASDLFKS